MENIFGIVVVVAIAGFVIWKFTNKDSSSVEVSAPEPAKAPEPAPVKVKVPSKTVLSKMTKKQIDELAQNDFGVVLDARKNKDEMIKTFQKEAKRAAEESVGLEAKVDRQAKLLPRINNSHFVFSCDSKHGRLG